MVGAGCGSSYGRKYCWPHYTRDYAITVAIIHTPVLSAVTNGPLVVFGVKILHVIEYSLLWQLTSVCQWANNYRVSLWLNFHLELCHFEFLCCAQSMPSGAGLWRHAVLTQMSCLSAMEDKQPLKSPLSKHYDLDHLNIIGVLQNMCQD